MGPRFDQKSGLNPQGSQSFKEKRSITALHWREYRDATVHKRSGTFSAFNVVGKDTDNLLGFNLAENTY
jgi:hypothetical protein